VLESDQLFDRLRIVEGAEAPGGRVPPASSAATAQSSLLSRLSWSGDHEIVQHIRGARRLRLGPDIFSDAACSLQEDERVGSTALILNCSKRVIKQSIGTNRLPICRIF
jgi:hypothetical protein